MEFVLVGRDWLVVPNKELPLVVLLVCEVLCRLLVELLAVVYYTVGTTIVWLGVMSLPMI
jgi:hypothetical protein